MATITNVRKMQGDQFIDDLRAATEYMVFARANRAFFRIRKMELMQEAEEQKIHYYMTDKVYKNGRLVMVLI